MVMGTQEQGRLIQLRNDQRLAIETEDYEAAARLRDEIAKLELALRPKPEPKAKGRKKARPESEE